MRIVVSQAVSDCQLAKGIGEKCAILFCGLAELSRPLQFLGVAEVLAQSAAACGFVFPCLSVKSRSRNQ